MSAVPSEIVRARITRLPRPGSEIEEMFALHIKADKLPAPDREFIFDPKRGWRLDFAWPRIRLYAEVDGEVHRIKEQFHKDIHKRAHALMQGWAGLHVSGREVRSGEAIKWLKALLWERT